MTMEGQLLKKQLLEAISHIKNVSQQRVMEDRVPNHLKKIGSKNWNQESINDMLCILYYKGFIDDNFTLAKSKTESNNHGDVVIRISHVIYDSENLYSISRSRLAVSHTMTTLLNLEKFTLV